MFFKRLIYRLIHDALYDWYEEVKKGRESVVNFIIHWGLWVGGFVFAHVFWAMILYYTCMSIFERYQRIAAVIIIFFAYTSLWFFIDKLYEGDRPTVKGVNDRWIVEE